MAMKIEIMKRPKLPDIEALISKLASTQESQLEVWLARDMGSAFFVESRMVALLASAARKGTVSIVDWAGGDIDGWRERFTSELCGVAALGYSSGISTSKKEPIPASVTELKASIEERGGMAEQNSGGRSLTYCAFDEKVRQQPLDLASIRTKSKFCSEFVRRLNTAFHTDGTHPDLFRQSPEKCLAEFVYELYQNSFEHGCLSKDNQLIRGLRLLHVKRHIAHSKAELLSRAEGFKELQEYFSDISGDRGASRFYEVAISDQGLGIVDRFVATRAEYADLSQSYDSRINLINEIMDKALSSKINQPGAGHGLRKSILAIRELGGFVSVRSGDLWLHSSPTTEVSNSDLQILKPVKPIKQVSRVEGTHFNILVQAP